MLYELTIIDRWLCAAARRTRFRTDYVRRHWWCNNHRTRCCCCRCRCCRWRWQRCDGRYGRSRQWKWRCCTRRLAKRRWYRSVIEWYNERGRKNKRYEDWKNETDSMMDEVVVDVWRIQTSVVLMPLKRKKVILIQENISNIVSYFDAMSDAFQSICRRHCFPSSRKCRNLREKIQTTKKTKSNLKSIITIFS